MLAWLKRRLQNSAALLVFSFNRFLDWLFSSRIPAVVHVREFIRHSDFLLRVARSFIHIVRQLPKWLGELFVGRSGRRLRSILAAREIGGSITVSEFEQIWSSTKRGTRVVAIAAKPELEQILIILKAAKAKAVTYPALAATGVDNINPSDLDLIIAAPGSGVEQQIEALRKKLQKPKAFLRVGENSRRSDYYELNLVNARTVQGTNSIRGSVEENLAQGIPLRVVFLNDVGFQYGAGIALKRQVASFLLKGFEVHLVAWTPGMEVFPPKVTGIPGFEGWRGAHNVSEDHRGKGKSGNQLIASVLSTIRALEPDVIITGNLHGTGVPLELAQGLKSINALVVSYMHDCFWATGRCAYPVSCKLYQTGCNETCPTADEYPKLSRDKIAPAWRTKADVFEGESGIPLVANSGWTRDLAVGRFGDRARIDCVVLAVDHELFAPIPKAVARRLLGLPTKGTFVVMGAVDILNRWKGGNLFREIHEKLQSREDVSILLFGDSSILLKSTKSFGLVQDERLMPLILNSADVFVGTATEEAFGQTLLEASACGVPVAAFDRGGVSDIVVDGQTGLLVKSLNADELYKAIDRLLADPSLRELLGRNARKRVESYFTLTRQADAWIRHLQMLSDLKHRAGKPAMPQGS
jgi:glycosyltransferase involved in cell wall biosynthesis